MKFAHTVLAALSFAGVMHAASAGVINSAPLTFTQDNREAAKIALKHTYTENVLVDFSFSYDGVLVNNTFTSLWFGNSDGPSLGLKANCGDTNRNCRDLSVDVFGRTLGTHGAWVPKSNLSGDKEYTIVGYLQKVNGSATYNQFDVWLNPGTTNLAELAKLGHASFVGASTLESFSKIGVRTANLKGQTITYIDNIRLNEVPEPGSIALMSLALAGMGLVARRKRN